jgi:hypothetical protein
VIGCFTKPRLTPFMTTDKVHRSLLFSIRNHIKLSALRLYDKYLTISAILSHNYRHLRKEIFSQHVSSCVSSRSRWAPPRRTHGAIRRIFHPRILTTTRIPGFDVCTRCPFILRVVLTTRKRSVLMRATYKHDHPLIQTGKSHPQVLHPLSNSVLLPETFLMQEFH